MIFLRAKDSANKKGLYKKFKEHQNGMFFKISSVATLVYSIITSKEKNISPLPLYKYYTSLLHISAPIFILRVAAFQLGTLAQVNTRMPSSMWRHLYFVNALQRIASFIWNQESVW